MRGLYVHIPFCDGKCRYCAFYSVPWERALADRYLGAVERELHLRRAELGGLEPETVYVGGGTPTVLSLPQIERLGVLILGAVSTRRIVEWSVEANPSGLTRAVLRRLRAMGATRISLGAQSFEAAALRRLGRRHTPAQIRRAVDRIRGEGFANFGLDLIACVPGVSEAQWRRTIEEAVRAGPAHVSVYALTIEEATPLAADARARRVTALDSDRELAMLSAAERTLEAAGFQRYEISNYAQPGFECRHNVSCWRGEEYLGVGPAAASRVGSRRWSNAADLDAYASALERGRLPPRSEERVTPVTDVLDRVIFGLRTAAGIEPGKLFQGPEGAALRARTRFPEAVEELRRARLLTGAGRRIRLTRRGRNLADYVAVRILQRATAT